MAIDYIEYLKTGTWELKRLEKLRTGLWSRGHCLCQRCCRLVHQCGIEVHHLTYERLGNEELSDLQIVCAGCHKDIHGHTVPWWWDGIEGHERRHTSLLAHMSIPVACGKSVPEAFEAVAWGLLPVVTAEDIMEERYGARHI